jgi:hypothetical protein
MATEAERIRQEIASTRAELAQDVERLAQQTSPRPLATRVMSRLRRVRESALGPAEQAASTVADQLHRAGDSAAGMVHDVGETLQQTPRKVARATEGSPVGVGLIAFGGGMLAAALIPETEAERRAAHQVAERVGPIVAPLREAGQAVADDIREAVGEAGEQLRTAATQAAGHVQSVAAEGVAEVRSAASRGVSETASATRDAASGASDVLHEASDRARATIEQARRET